MQSEVEIETECDDLQNNETPHLIQNTAETTYQMLK